MPKKALTVDEFLQLFGDVEGGLEFYDGQIFLGGVPFGELVNRYQDLPDVVDEGP